jgi:hypothetical protein
MGYIIIVINRLTPALPRMHSGSKIKLKVSNTSFVSLSRKLVEFARWIPSITLKLVGSLLFGEM